MNHYKTPRIRALSPRAFRAHLKTKQRQAGRRRATQWPPCPIDSETHSRLIIALDSSSAQERVPLGGHSLELNAFRVELKDTEEGSQLLIWGPHDRERASWRTSPDQPLLFFRTAEAEVSESRGFYKIKERATPYIIGETIDRFYRTSSVQEDVVIEGDLSDGMGRWRLSMIALDDRQLQFEAQVHLTAQVQGRPRLCLQWEGHPTEAIFGLGTQFTWVNLKGRVIPILSQEPGIGRGIEPLTTLLERGWGAGGSDVQSNAPAAHFISSTGLSLCLESHCYSSFDFSSPRHHRVEVWADSLVGRLFSAPNPLGLIEAYTRFAGRMPPLPKWLNDGAIIGMQGGSARVLKAWERLSAAGVPISAFWLQDWVGARKTSVGEQLWWNWEVDDERYPQWETLLSTLDEAGVRVLGYLNPFLVDPTPKRGVKRDLCAEARANDFLVKDPSGRPYSIMNTSFSAHLLDLSNPEACAWLKEVIRVQLIGAGLSGWMADFGEALPFDAQLFSGEAETFHNAYPEVWARLNREVIQEEGLEGEVVFFTRSGFTQTPRFSTLMWLGDQLTSWRREDGIYSAVAGLLSSGFSGVSLNHSDIGGYTTTNPPWLKPRLPLIGFRRTPELLMRWVELNAFTAVFRTHEGNQPQRNHQVTDDEETLAHFAYFARVYQALSEYRASLMIEASSTGAPMVRHTWLEFPEDPEATQVHDQFMLGSDLLIAPCLSPQQHSTTLYLPHLVDEAWVHLWSGAQVDRGAQPLHASSSANNESSDKLNLYGQWVEVETPLYRPAVFYRSGSIWGAALHRNVGDL